MPEVQETRVRLGAKQTARGTIKLDIMTEAPTVDQAGRLMGEAVARLRMELATLGLELTSEVARQNYQPHIDKASAGNKDDVISKR